MGAGVFAIEAALGSALRSATTASAAESLRTRGMWSGRVGFRKPIPGAV
jgi:hypothetical protein